VALIKRESWELEGAELEQAKKAQPKQVVWGFCVVLVPIWESVKFE
jgi:hypothetical protein